MTLGEFNASIRASRVVMEECKILRATANLHSLEASLQFRTAALNAGTTYRELYLCGVENGDYNLLLDDYSFLQYSYTMPDHYRLAYYPNPFAGMGAGFAAEVEEAVDDGVLSYEEYSQYVSEQPYDVRIPVIRFELHVGACRASEHPAAHFHVGLHTENRWPVARKLTPRMFSLLIAKTYYSENWRVNGAMEVDGDGFVNAFDRKSVGEKNDCQLLGGELFHETERQQLHFI